MSHRLYKVNRVKHIEGNLADILKEVWESTRGVKSKVWLIMGLWVLASALVASPFMGSNFDSMRLDVLNAVAPDAAARIEAAAPAKPTTTVQAPHEFSNGKPIAKRSTSQAPLTKGQKHTLLLRESRIIFFTMIAALIGWLATPCLYYVCLQRLSNETPLRARLPKRFWLRYLSVLLGVTCVNYLVQSVLIMGLGPIGHVLTLVAEFVIFIMFFFCWGLLLETTMPIKEAVKYSVQAAKMNFGKCCLVVAVCYLLFLASCISIIGIIWGLPFLYTMLMLVYRKAFELERSGE